MNDKNVICPLLSVGRAEAVDCFGERCAWYVQHGNYRGEVVGEDCALATVADNMDGGLVCIGGGGGLNGG